jgi:cytochrome c biogenesis protein CcdA
MTNNNPAARALAVTLSYLLLQATAQALPQIPFLYRQALRRATNMLSILIGILTIKRNTLITDL